ncbi:MAG: AsmA family protein [Pseudomonadota bacterium]
MRLLFRFLGFLFVVTAIAVVGVLMLPADRIAAIATDQLSKATGRNVSISGDVRMTFWPVLGVTAEGLEVGNAGWAKETTMLTTAQAAIGVDAAALLTGAIKITNIEAQSPTIRLESRADGRASWLFTDGGGAAAIETERPADGGARPVTIERLAVTNATLIYDAEGADLVSYNGVDLTLDWPDPAGAADIVAAMSPSGSRVTLAARVERFAGFLAGAVQPIDVSVTAAGGTLRLAGRASLDGAVAGKATLNAPDTGAFLAALGAGRVDLPQGLGRSVDFVADMTLTTDRALALREVEADLGGNAVRAAADITLNGTPQINAQVFAGDLDLSALTRGDASGEAAAATTGWPKAPIDAAGLASFNGAIALRADSIDLGTLSLGATRALLSNDRSRMVFELREVAAYGGAVTGQFVMNNRNGLSVGGKLNAAGVQMKPLLGDLAGITRFTGEGNARLSFLGVGQNLDAIMRSLSGDGTLSTGRGTIEGIDLDNLLGSFDVQGGTTVFDAMSANFTMNAGVLRNDDLKMLLPNVEATGAGEINLGAQSLDYTFTPKALRVNGGRGLAVPVRIVGPWADPSIRPDVSAAIDLNFREERERAEERVKQQVADKVEEELGIVREEGQSVEDALKDGLEDKLKKELFRLFD